MWEQDLKMTWRIKEEIIHFQHPETEHPSVLRSFVCRYYWIGLAVICQGCYYQGCGDFETFGFSPGKAVSLSGSSQFVPFQTQNGPEAGHSSNVPSEDGPRRCQRTPWRAIAERRERSRVRPPSLMPASSVLSYDPFQQRGPRISGA